ncbi:DUF7507 domain-containing protein [Salininema proteolyticum]|uniref:Uncharacterized protein n=1 Tax=Salininema proteolyticum TaxID=1607685 RepID=A0ABV8TWK1_9ACTN
MDKLAESIGENMRREFMATAAAVLMLNGAAPEASAQTSGSLLLSETFAEETVTDSGFQPLGAACLTGAAAGNGSVVGDCAAYQNGPVPIVGETPGYLQLTDSRGARTGGIVYNNPLPGNGGLQVTFEQYQYGGTGADGISFFLVDGSADLESTGAYGGSLGYAQRGGDSGVRAGYLGVGLDAYGNYAVDFEGRGTGCPEDQRAPDEYQVYDRPPNNVTLRGPGNGTDRYCYLAGTGTTEATGTDPDGNTLYGSSLPGDLHVDTTDPESAKRTVRLTVSEDEFPTVTVEADFNDGNGFQQVLQTTMTSPVPPTYKFGFAASTGSDDDVHLIRNVEVRSLVALAELNLVKQVYRPDGSAPPERYNVGDNVVYQYVVTNTGTSPLTDVEVDDSVFGPVTCPSTELAPAGDEDSTMTCTVDYAIRDSDIRDGKIVNTAVAEGEHGGGDRIESPEAEVSIDVDSPSLSMSKTVSQPAADPGDSLTYEITATNTGVGELSNATFTDDLSKVLAGAEYNGDAQASTGNVAVSGETLTWTGSLPEGESTMVTYSVVVADGFAGTLNNRISSEAPGSNCPTDEPTADGCTAETVVEDQPGPGPDPDPSPDPGPEPEPDPDPTDRSDDSPDDKETLAVTGAPSASVLLGGMALIIAGVLLLWAVRRNLPSD